MTETASNPLVPASQALKAKQAFAKKLEQARDAARPVEKAGKNQAQHYDYVRAEDVIREARKALAGAGLVVCPEVVETTFREQQTRSGGSALMVTAKLRFELISAEAGARRVFEWQGTGWDAPGDKALYKAITGGTKYFLLSLLQIPFGDDPEHETKAEGAPAQTPPVKLGTTRINALIVTIKARGLTYNELGVVLGAAGIDGLRANSEKAVRERLSSLTNEQADALEAALANG